MENSEQIHDVLVVGAGVAGAAAAALLAASKTRVVLVDAQAAPDDSAETVWLASTAKALLQEAGVSTKPLFSLPIKRCELFSASFDKRITPEVPADEVHFVRTSDLLSKLIDSVAASKHGQVLSQSRVVNVAPGEDFVKVTFEDRTQAFGRFLVLAAEANSTLLEQIGLESGAATHVGLWTASYCCPRGDYAEPGQADFVLGIGDATGYGYRLAGETELSVGVCVPSSSSQAQSDLAELSERFAQHALLPENWRTCASSAESKWSPAGAALERESHVAKRTLVIGQAGGFVASQTNAGAYPALWSAQLACKVIREALVAAQPQDKLRDFEHLWRTSMVDYLRPPNADPQSLLSLIFTNRQMAGKMVEALLLGTNF